jgi:hypothetical protein
MLFTRLLPRCYSTGECDICVETVYAVGVLVTRSLTRRGRLGFFRCATAICAILALVSGAPLSNAKAAQIGAQELSQLSTSDLQAAFQAVSRGTLPAGYPSISRGQHVPASILEAVSWTESKWRQFVAPNRPLVSYDGGYGIMQITTGMQSGGLPAPIRSAIENNALYNLGFGAQQLASKRLATPKIGNNDATVLEHWYYALWAYNGWGWRNNPLNPIFTRTGTPVSNPSGFPYQEVIYYWLAHPPTAANGSPLWTPVVLRLPDPKTVGVKPRVLPEVTKPHRDAVVQGKVLSISAVRGARFVKDVTVPDGTVVESGQRFRKTWLLANTGTETWGAGYHWAPVGANPFAGAGEVSIQVTPPLANVQVSTDLIAPAKPGTYRGYWEMVGPNARSFGARAWVSVVVTATRSKKVQSSHVQVTPIATAATLIGSSSSNGTPAASLKLSSASAVQSDQTSSDVGDAAVFNGDISVPDGTVFVPGAHFALRRGRQGIPGVSRPEHLCQR